MWDAQQAQRYLPVFSYLASSHMWHGSRSCLAALLPVVLSPRRLSDPNSWGSSSSWLSSSPKPGFLYIFYIFHPPNHIPNPNDSTSTFNVSARSRTLANRLALAKITFFPVATVFFFFFQLFRTPTREIWLRIAGWDITRNTREFWVGTLVRWVIIWQPTDLFHPCSLFVPHILSQSISHPAIYIYATIFTFVFKRHVHTMKMHMITPFSSCKIMSISCTTELHNVLENFSLRFIFSLFNSIYTQ